MRTAFIGDRTGRDGVSEKETESFLGEGLVGRRILIDVGGAYDETSQQVN
jgi:hypothetical protein